jgi:hypothetical protein
VDLWSNGFERVKKGAEMQAKSDVFRNATEVIVVSSVAGYLALFAIYVRQMQTMKNVHNNGGPEFTL